MGVSIQTVNAGGTALFVAHVPPMCSVTISTQDNNADVAWGMGSTVTFGTGSIVPPAGSYSFVNPATSPPFDIWVIASTGTHEVSVQLVTPR